MRSAQLIFFLALSACTLSVQANYPNNAGQDAAIRGVVRNVDGWELEGIQVVAISDDGQGARTGYTDASGIYSIEEVGYGSYSIVVSRGHSVVAQRGVKVLAAGARNTHFMIPSVFGDRPDQRNLPIVDRSLRLTAGK